MIVAMATNRVIGINNSLPWRLSGDLKNFKKLTMGHHMIMGRKTFESIGKALPGRTTIIVTRNANYKAENCFIATSVEKALEIAKERNEEEVFICGGAEIYKLAQDQVEKVYLTEVEYSGDGDAFFAEFNYDNWQLQSEEKHSANAKNQFPWSFKILTKNLS